MPFTFRYPSSFKKELRKAPDEAEDVIENILNDPSIGESLHHNLEGYKKISFGRSPEFRILYTVDYKCKKKKWGKFLCKYGICSEREIQECLGYIEFKYALTREAMNNIYRLRKKDLR